MKKIFLLLVILMVACSQRPMQETKKMSNQSNDAAFKTIHDAYVVEFLRRNPVVNTYLGGAGLDPSLRDVDGRLRDHSAAALAAEDRWLADTLKAFLSLGCALICWNFL